MEGAVPVRGRTVYTVRNPAPDKEKRHILKEGGMPLRKQLEIMEYCSSSRGGKGGAKGLRGRERRNEERNCVVLATPGSLPEGGKEPKGNF